MIACEDVIPLYLGIPMAMAFLALVLFLSAVIAEILRDR